VGENGTMGCERGEALGVTGVSIAVTECVVSGAVDGQWSTIVVALVLVDYG
jgi:hypothetical protein